MSNLFDFYLDKIPLLMDPNSGYTIKDFEKEFSNVSSTIEGTINNTIEIPFINESTNKDHEYATEFSSGFDFKANLNEPLILKPKQFLSVPTGLYFELPNNLEIQVRPRSGLALKYGITVLNSPGTIDSDYRGEVKVILINHSDKDFIINNGDRIAQGVISSYISKNSISFKKVDKLNDNTERSTGGFGSTGIN